MSEDEIDDMIQQFFETLECGDCSQRMKIDSVTNIDYYCSCPNCKLKIKINKLKLKVQMFGLLTIV